MILCINTKEQNKVIIALRDAHGKVLKTLSAKNKFGSQVLLPLIVKLLRTSTPRVPARIDFYRTSGRGFRG
ncbi:hypothetical protein HYT18_05360 [Candidatus Microgenomates bacterium]|nr:hypothetical protein [Candidatus Microgenomates bacterium]